MIITNKFIKENATNNMGWTKEQLKLIGISWPPRKGWKKEVIGNYLSDEKAYKFKELGTVQKKKNKEKKKLNISFTEKEIILIVASLECQEKELSQNIEYSTSSFKKDKIKEISEVIEKIKQAYLDR